ncbi:hypothetical protein [Viridibacillus arvi]|uniref:hypothetical protein n=1 Tax=Viridibacillus arvi TaxID=263475 RepID=UPI0034CFAD0E
MATTRTIYLPSSKDLTLYNDAKEDAVKKKTSVSNLILKLLGEYMEKTTAKLPCTHYVISIGVTGKMNKKSFMGVFLASEKEDSISQVNETLIFQTQKRKIVVYTKRTLKNDQNHEENEMYVYETLEDVPNISDFLYNLAKEKSEIADAEFLDI